MTTRADYAKTRRGIGASSHFSSTTNMTRDDLPRNVDRDLSRTMIELRAESLSKRAAIFVQEVPGNVEHIFKGEFSGIEIMEKVRTTV